MFQSQVLEVMIGLSMMLFFIALLSSAVVEVIGTLLGKRAADLEKELRRMLGDEHLSTLERGNHTSWRDRWKKPSYLTAREFADLALIRIGTIKSGAADVAELYRKLPAPMRDALQPFRDRADVTIDEVREASAAWFDDRMSRLQGAYKRWSQLMLFVAALAIAGTTNASMSGVATKLWSDPVTRAAVTDSAAHLVDSDAPTAPKTFDDVAEQVDGLDETKLPLGWGEDASLDQILGDPLNLLGILATALLALLGAPFWFDLLSKFVSIRGTGPKPPSDDGRAAGPPAGATATGLVIAAASGGSDLHALVPSYDRRGN